MTTKTMRRGIDAKHVRGAVRGWGQVCYAADGSWSWPAGSRRRSEFRFDDPIDEQLRHGIAWSRSSSHSIARAAGVSPAVIDRFMQGADCLTLGDAARIAPLVGLRFADQSLIAGFINLWKRSGQPEIHCPPNRLAKRVAARRRISIAR